MSSILDLCYQENRQVIWCSYFKYDVLELALGFPIESVKVSKEKCIVCHPEYKGVRLDIVAKDENRTHYNIEMQVAKKTAVGKRSRYYHSQIDMELLQTGLQYALLPDAYVDAKAEGKAETILEILGDLGEEIPVELREKIMQETDFAVLKFYRKKASAANSVAEFEKMIAEYPEM